MQTGWTRAEPDQVAATIAWLDGISPGGSTCPKPAYERVFRNPPPPDVVYYLNDGDLGELGPAECASLRGSHRIMINTISLETPGSVAALEQIAAESGGTYRHIASVTAI